MNRDGFRLIERSLTGAAMINPEPGEDENARFVELISTGVRTAGYILNRLEKDGLIAHEGEPIEVTDGSLPRLKLIGQSAVQGSAEETTTHFLTFEDITYTE